jgi:hypothetical protein|tara:strand:- start:248 stop:901 length:654 start_codon:yes stop_codon:yes gene_type:complete
VIVFNKINILSYLGFIIVFFSSCEKNNNYDPTNEEEVISFVELDASDFLLNLSDTSATGTFTKFSFSEGDTVNHNNWDVAFRGTTIIVNGGAKAHNDQPDRTGNAAVYIAIGSMSEINSVDTNRLFQDNVSGSAILENMMVDDLGISGEGWASYNYQTHIISPIPGRILVFRTQDNKYAKMEVLSFYDNPNPNPSEGDYGGFYTFNYVYQSNGGTTF